MTMLQRCALLDVELSISVKTLNATKGLLITFWDSALKSTLFFFFANPELLMMFLCSLCISKQLAQEAFVIAPSF